MERVLFSMTLAPGTEVEYQRRHDEIWPDLVADLYAAGWRNYSLFRDGLTVYGYVECDPDFSSAQAAMESSEANRRWQEWFADIIVASSGDGDALGGFEQVWHLDEHLAREVLGGG